jgi:hypothetical protein
VVAVVVVATVVLPIGLYLPAAQELAKKYWAE